MAAGYPNYGYPPTTQGYPPSAPFMGQPPPSTYPAAAGVYAPPPPAYYAPPELVSWFFAVDQDGSGRIEVAELNAALSSAGFRFSIGTTEKLLLRYDNDRSGSITMEEFSNLHEFITTMRDGFRQRDASGDGRLDGYEVRESLRRSGFVLSEETFQAVMRKFDRQRRGSLGFDDYIELSLFLAQVRDTFGYADLDRRGHVVFNFDSFLGTVATIS
ncbi:EF hand-like protein [Novymonas esmeraldas]|uniref:EF hand-like protein n=1 Tax=Novymonas esmeraldas TaxID=1808958 RepID=A0AAW0ETD2_9TRYP